MNMYDMVPIKCKKCDVSIGEVDYDAKIINPLCGQCANPLPEGDKILYTISKFQSMNSKKIVEPLLISV